MLVYFVFASSDWTYIYGSVAEMVCFNAHSDDRYRVYEPLARQTLETDI